MRPWHQFIPHPAVTLISNTKASPTVFTTRDPHGFEVGDVVTIAGVVGADVSPNGDQTITVVGDTTHFTVAVNCGTAGGTGGTAVLKSRVNGKSSVLLPIQSKGDPYAQVWVSTDNAYDIAVYGSESPINSVTGLPILYAAAGEAAAATGKYYTGIVVANWPYIAAMVKNVGADASVVTGKLNTYRL